MRRKQYRLLALVALVVIVTWLIKTSGKYSSMSPVTVDKNLTDLPLRYQEQTEKYCDKYNEESTTKGRGYKNFTLLKFLDNFKNPCFLQNASNIPRGIPKDENLIKLRCIPYFFIAGFPKSGTTDLWHRLVKHPDVKANHNKELGFIHSKRNSYSMFESAANEYMEYFKNTTLAIQRVISPALWKEGFPYHHAITGEGSVDAAHFNPKWKFWPGNENCTEPVVTNANYVHQINPNMKIIFMIRDPADRLYSDYIYEARFYRYKTSVEDFHSSAITAIKSFQQCANQYSVRFCAYNTSLDTPKIRIRLGMYHIFIDDWQGVFGINNILIANSESTLGQNRLATYRELLKFLDLRPFTPDEELVLLRGGLVNARFKHERKTGDMWNETRSILNEFYAPFNEQVSKFNIY